MKNINTSPHNYNNKMDTDMIEEIAEVISVESGFANVRPLSSSACQGCSSKAGCSTTSFFSPKKKANSIIKVQNPVYAKPGDNVVIGVSSSALVGGSLLTYMLPILTLLMCAVLGTEVFRYFGFNAEIGSIIFGLLGLFAGFYIARVSVTQTHVCNNLDIMILRIKDQELHPVVIA